MKPILVFVVASTLNAGLVFADGWEWFRLCARSIGPAVHPFRHRGVERGTRFFMDTTRIRGIVPLKSDRCVILDMGSGPAGNIAVEGPLERIWCKIRTGPDCRDE